MTYLEDIKACIAGRKWADSCSSYRDAWEKCERGDWMLWIAKNQKIDIRVLTRAKVECAKLVEHLMTDDRSVNALRVAEKFAAGAATEKDLSDAAAAAAAADAYDAYDAYDAADAAAYAAAANAANAAYAAAYDDAAAGAAADLTAAAAYAAANDARAKTLLKTADICRQYITFESLEIPE